MASWRRYLYAQPAQLRNVLRGKELSTHPCSAEIRQVLMDELGEDPDTVNYGIIEGTVDAVVARELASRTAPRALHTSPQHTLLERSVILDTFYNELVEYDLDNPERGERLYRVLDLRFGLSNGIERTLVEVGEIMGISDERVQQLEARAIGYLRRQFGIPKYRKGQRELSRTTGAEEMKDAPHTSKEIPTKPTIPDTAPVNENVPQSPGQRFISEVKRLIDYFH